jgi:hypothetical protein
VKDQRQYLFFAGYLLTVNPDNRPDIFQASYAAFQIAGLDCPVINLHVREIYLRSLCHVGEFITC